MNTLRHDNLQEFSPEITEKIDIISRLFSTGSANSIAVAIEKCSSLGWEHERAVVPFLDDLLPLLVTSSQASEEGLLYAIYHCAPDSIPPLINLLSHERTEVKVRAAKTLATIGKKAVDAEPALTRLLGEKEDVVVQAACHALGQIFAHSERAITQLNKKCHDTNLATRSAAVHALAVIANNAKLAHSTSICRDTLIAAASDGDIEVRRSAYYGLRAMSFPSDEKGVCLIRLLSFEHEEAVQARIVEAMICDADSYDYREVVPFLVSKLSTHNRELFAASCDLLERMGASATVAVPVLLRMLEVQGDVSVARTIWRISRRADYVIPVLSQQFEDDGERICDICYEMGHAASPLLPKLLEALSADDYWDLQWAASDAIGKVATGNPDVVPSLLAAMTHESPIVLASVARSLACVGLAAVEPLMELAQSDHAIKRNYAIYALGKLGHQAAQAVPLLCRLLAESADPMLERVAAIALAHISGDPAALPILMRELTGGSEDAPIVDLINALAAVGPLASASINLLEYIARDLDGTEVGEAASSALLKISP